MSLWGRPSMVIARREVLERVRSKWFIFGTLLGPLAMLVVVLVPALLAARAEKVVELAIVMPTAAPVGQPPPAGAGPAAPTAAEVEALGRELVAGFFATGWKAHLSQERSQARLLGLVREQKLNGFLVIPNDFLGDGELTYRGDNGTNALAMTRLRAVVSAVVQHRRGVAAGISEEQVLRLVTPVRLATAHTTGEGEGSSGMATFVVGYVVMFLLYISIMLYASNVMRSVVQEKTSRVVELMVAAVKPRALMTGKVIGVGAVGLLQVAVWLGMGVLILTYRDSLLGLVGVASPAGVSVPPLALDQVAVILLYFVLGYFLYAALYAAVGAMVSSEQEAQQAQMPLMTLIVLAVACVQLVANDPRGNVAVVLTTVPFFSPMLMPMRYLLGGTSAVSLVASVAALLVTIGLVVVAAGRIYRVGILMYGKRPSLRELWRWLRY